MGTRSAVGIETSGGRLDSRDAPHELHRAYATSIAALNAALTMNQASVRGCSPSTSVPHPLTVVPNTMPPDSAGSNPTTSVDAQPPPVANLVIAPPQTTMAAEVVENLSTTASNIRPIPTVVSSAPAYIPPARRPHVDPRPKHDHYLNVNRAKSDGTLRTSTTVVSISIIGHPLPPLNAHVAMNTRVGDNHNQVASAQRNIMQHYSTKWEMQQVQELRAVDEEIRRLQAKRAALVTGGGDPSTSTPNRTLAGRNQQLSTRLFIILHQHCPSQHSNLGQCQGMRHRFKNYSLEFQVDS